MEFDESRLTAIYNKWVVCFGRDTSIFHDNFIECTTNTEKADTVKNCFDKYPLDLFSERVGKDSAFSKTIREAGNAHYGKKEWDMALKCYSKSVSYAKQDSQDLAMALGNRAACLLNMGFVAEALVDVSRALEIAEIEDSYRDKLNNRKELCMTRIIETKEIPTRGKAPEMKSKSKYFDCSSDKVELKETELMGRCLVATEDVKTGEVLLVEKPYASVLIPNACYTHCSRCFFSNPLLIECPNCASAMYCSTECLNMDKPVHQYECPISQRLEKLEMGPIDFLSVRTLIVASLGDIPITSLTNEEPNDDTYKSSDLRRVYNLIGNQEKRDHIDVFRRGFSAVILTEFLKRFTNFFNKFSITESDARGFLLHLLQILPCNAHEVTASFKSTNHEIDPCLPPTEIKEIGAAVYPALSLLNHSCDPNFVRHCYGDLAIGRAIRPIRAGEEIVDNYGYHYATHNTKERKISLMRQYYFECKCHACLNQWQTYSDIPLEFPMFATQKEKERFNKNANKFNNCLQLALKEVMTEKDLKFLCSFVDYLDLEIKVKRPFRHYNNCQEAIKHTLDSYPQFNRC